jgi:ATP/maltotriose-dependent transcriptional regulator MalT
MLFWPGNLNLARLHIEQGLELAGQHALFLPTQYLYSTRGELALAENDPDTAASVVPSGAWPRRSGLVTIPQAVNIRANLGLVARTQGDFDEALMLLEEARQAARAQGTRFLQIKILLWLAELYA